MGNDMSSTGDVEKCGNHGSRGVEKCSGSGVSFRPDGIHELDPCIYETIHGRNKRGGVNHEDRAD